MKIAIAAAPNIDTRAHAESLASRFQCPVFENPAKSLCRELGFQTLYDIPEAEQLDIRVQLIELHEDQMKAGSGVHMTSVVNMLADWARWMWAHTTTEKWESVQRMAQHVAAQYDAIYWIKSGPELDYNGYDWLDRRNAAQICALIPFFADQLGVTAKMEIVK
jgi:hypothetical protein